jgi:hypothetical protein
MRVLDFVWPHVGKPSIDATLKEELASLDAASWDQDSESFLEEARRLRDVESGRKSAAETKSQIYLAVLIALLPVLISVSESEAFKGILSFDAWYRIAGFVFLVIGLVYGVGAMMSSFRVLFVGAYNRVDVEDLVKLASSKDRIGDLTKDILKSVRRDRKAVNRKVSYVMVTQGLTLRMALFLILALSVSTFAEPMAILLKALKMWIFC